MISNYTVFIIIICEPIKQNIIGHRLLSFKRHHAQRCKTAKYHSGSETQNS